MLASYIRQGMRFFVAKVNIEAHDESGYTNLRPLQVAFEHDRFMLPIRLGTLNAKRPSSSDISAPVVDASFRSELTSRARSRPRSVEASRKSEARASEWVISTVWKGVENL